MSEQPADPCAVPFGAVRIARRSNQYEQAVEFYRDVVRLPLVHYAETGVDGHGCAIFALQGASATFELIPAREQVTVDRHDQLVLYFPGAPERDVVADRLAEHGYQAVDQNRYWSLNGAVTVLDPDGREVVLAPWVFGTEPPPMRRQATNAPA